MWPKYDLGLAELPFQFLIGESSLNRYHSPYPNYVHQLFVTPSKHLYVLRDGQLKWQKKAMEITLHGLEKSDREHVIYYLLADHNSAAFYAEVQTSKTCPEPIDFLKRAWSKKEDFFFYGLPENLMLPAVVSARHPEIRPYLDSINVGNFPPPSGFAAGIHHIRNWEKDIVSAVQFDTFLTKTPCTLESLSKSIRYALVHSNDQEINRPGVHQSRREIWENPHSGKPALRLPF